MDCKWLIASEHQRCITVYSWLLLVALATLDLVGDNREIEV